jgi:hypothetical protein
MPAKMKSNTKPAPAGKIAVQNVNIPGYTHLVDAAMYNAMRKAVLKAMPARAPGLTQTEMRLAVLPYLPADLFPDGAKANWWSKAVQLDLEAKGLLVREATKPIRWHRTGKS